MADKKEKKEKKDNKQEQQADPKKTGKKQATPEELKLPSKCRLQKVYEEEIASELIKEFKFKNTMEVPRITKVVLNMGMGEAVLNPKIIDSAVSELATITGQKPIITRARKSIANFKLREDMQIGVKVTLHRQKMWEFLDRFINVALPRVRDFRGVSRKAFDGKGNYTVGIQEQIIFPEINYDKIDKIKGLNITIVTTAKTDDEARSLLTKLGMPFRKK